MRLSFLRKIGISFQFSWIVCAMVLFLFIIAISLVIFKGDFVLENNGNVFKYQYFVYNSLDNESSRGFVSIDKQLEENEFIARNMGNGHHTLISNFGTIEYKCTGSCVCNDVISRRTTTVFTRGIIHLVAAVSSLIAYSEAKKYFENECVNEISDKCTLSSIYSDVESCEPVESPSVEQNLKSLVLQRFVCRGHCQPKIFSKLETRQKAKEFGCENLKSEALVEIYSKPKNVEHVLANREARRAFCKEHLVKFCKENSRDKFYYTFNGGQSGQWKNIILCVADDNHKLRKRKGEYGRPNIRCTRIRE